MPLPPAQTSIIQTEYAVVNTSGYRGNLGATGATGNTGNTGPIGNRGHTGTSVTNIFRANSDGITVYLTDGSSILVSGISGNTYNNLSQITEYYRVIGSDIITSFDSFEIRGNVTGLTASFKPIKFSGNLETVYQENQKIIQIKGNATSTRVGISGSILIGDTGTNVVDFDPELMFYTHLPSNYPYGQTFNVFSAVLSNFYFAQGATAYNYNILSPITNNIDVVLKGITTETFFNNTYFNPADKSILVKNTFRTAFAKEPLKFPTAVGETTITTTQYILEPETEGITHINYKGYEIGSCCYCDTSGRSCKNYITRDYCTRSGNSHGLSGSFSFIPCLERKGSSCNSYGKCCINGICLDLVESECERLNGNFTRNVFCTSPTSCS